MEGAWDRLCQPARVPNNHLPQNNILVAPQSLSCLCPATVGLSRCEIARRRASKFCLLPFVLIGLAASVSSKPWGPKRPANSNVVRFELDLTWGPLNPNGHARHCILMNGQFPGQPYNWTKAMRLSSWSTTTCRSTRVSTFTG